MKNILIIMGRYLPGYNNGGPVRSTNNLVDHLGDEYNFKIVAFDRDRGDKKRYDNIKVYDWNMVGKARVYYIEEGSYSLRLIGELTKDVDIVYTWGCFNKFSLYTLILKRFNIISAPVVLASMGLFSPKAFRIKYTKKKIATIIYNLMGLFRNVQWSLTSEMELEEVRQHIRIKDNYFIAKDLPRKISYDTIDKKKDLNFLKVVWISRIDTKKNLLGAINILSKIEVNAIFTIYGPIYNKEYWYICSEALSKLPPNIKWEYKGSVESESVVEKLRKHHVFLFPTFGENYGHVIQEALSAGCPCILSDTTPWNNLEEVKAGFVFDIDDVENFKLALERYALMNEKEFNICVHYAKKYVIKNCKNSIENTGYRKMFNAL